MENRKQTPQTDEISSKHPCSKACPHSTGSNAILMFTNCLDISFTLVQEVMKGCRAPIARHCSNHPRCLHNSHLADGERLAVWKISWDNPQTESTMRGRLELGRLQLTNMFHPDRLRAHHQLLIGTQLSLPFPLGSSRSNPFV